MRLVKFLPILLIAGLSSLPARSQAIGTVVSTIPDNLKKVDQVFQGQSPAAWAIQTTVDFKITNFNNGNAQLFKVGLDGTVTTSGPIVLPGDPVAANQAATKAYVDAHAGSGGTGSVTFPTTTNLFKGDNAGGIMAATPGTDYATPASVATAQSTADAAIPSSQKGVANGVASLGADGKVPTSQLPAGNGSTGGVGGSGTAAYLMQWVDAVTAGDSYIDFGITHAGAYTSSKPLYGPAFYTEDTSGAAGGAAWSEGTDHPPVSGQDILYAGQADHALMMANNGDPAQFVMGSTSFVTLTDGASITWAGNRVRLPNAVVTLDHNTATRALNFTGLVNGSSGVLVIKQDATGGAALTGGTGCTWVQAGGGGANFGISTTANAIDILAFSYDGTNCYVSMQKNFN